MFCEHELSFGHDLFLRNMKVNFPCGKSRIVFGAPRSSPPTALPPSAFGCHLPRQRKVGLHFQLELPLSGELSRQRLRGSPLWKGCRVVATGRRGRRDGLIWSQRVAVRFLLLPIRPALPPRFISHCERSAPRPLHHSSLFSFLFSLFYPSRILASMLPIVSRNDGSVSIILEILSQAEIAVVWSLRSNSVAMRL